ncbi:MAG: hypothetical protein EXR67_04870 [Dehalococcoidia bacterium]|nr:hypothetical protein [Dehalococcoidia bacterium]
MWTIISFGFAGVALGIAHRLTMVWFLPRLFHGNETKALVFGRFFSIAVTLAFIMVFLPLYADKTEDGRLSLWQVAPLIVGLIVGTLAGSRIAKSLPSNT